MDKKEKLYERALATCVVMLIVCVILKLFGVQWFNLDTGIPLLNAIDRVVMESNLLSFVYSFVLLFINVILVCLLTTKSMDKRTILLISLFCVFDILFKSYTDYQGLFFILDTVAPLAICLKGNDFGILKEYVVVFLINIIYQLISIYVRDINMQIAFRGLVVGVLMNVDYYLMLIITYLYLKKGDKSLCSMFHHFGSSLASQLWKKHSQNSKQCFDKEI